MCFVSKICILHSCHSPLYINFVGKAVLVCLTLNCYGSVNSYSLIDLIKCYKHLYYLMVYTVPNNTATSIKFFIFH